MDYEVKKLINRAVYNVLDKTASDSSISKISRKHEQKIHFIPQAYRVFGGILQSMNIQFGNFIEELVSLLVDNENDYELIKEYSGKRSNAFTLSKTNEALIDNYITECQLSEEGFCNTEFPKLQEQLLLNKDTSKNVFRHDVDLLFRNKLTNKYYYFEIKYNDDHDSGKFVDINRKFIKTYAYLLNQLKIKRLYSQSSGNGIIIYGD
jgi:hypothetical protein